MPCEKEREGSIQRGVIVHCSCPPGVHTTNLRLVPRPAQSALTHRWFSAALQSYALSQASCLLLPQPILACWCPVLVLVDMPLPHSVQCVLSTLFQSSEEHPLWAVSINKPRSKPVIGNHCEKQ
jgi:hypothetical protein